WNFSTSPANGSAMAVSGTSREPRMAADDRSFAFMVSSFALCFDGSGCELAIRRVGRPRGPELWITAKESRRVPSRRAHANKKWREQEIVAMVRRRSAALAPAACRRPVCENRGQTTFRQTDGPGGNRSNESVSKVKTSGDLRNRQSKLREFIG